MIQEIFPDFYRLKLPFPNNPLRDINVYLVKAHGRALMVDTGINLPACEKALTSGLSELEVDLKETDFFITHMHIDHSGLVSSLATDSSAVYFSQPDAELYRDRRRGRWQEFATMARSNGFPLAELTHAASHPVYEFSKQNDSLVYRLLKQDDTVSIGDYVFSCIETPGHTRGHLCLYEPRKKLFLSGDHILIDVTPNVSCWVSDENPLADYLASLAKVYSLDVELVLPGHRNIFADMKQRIRELERHHQERADEALSILGKGSQNAYQVASQISWNLTYESWAEFPIWQKFFATGEALAHLNYLQAQGRVHQEARDGELVFSLG